MTTAIIYASQYGTTKRCATLLAELLPDAAVLSVNEAISLDDYSQVVLGTAIYAGRSMNNMTQWCATHLQELQTKRLGLFICCMNNNETTVQRQLDKAFPAELQQHATVRASFGGALTMSHLSLPEKAMLRVLGYSQDEDAVDTAAIREFAATLQSPNA